MTCVWADDLCIGDDMDSAPTASAYVAVDVHWTDVDDVSAAGGVNSTAIGASGLWGLSCSIKLSLSADTPPWSFHSLKALKALRMANSSILGLVLWLLTSTNGMSQGHQQGLLAGFPQLGLARPVIMHSKRLESAYLDYLSVLVTL